jgi:hypothetical protein
MNFHLDQEPKIEFLEESNSLVSCIRITSAQQFFNGCLIMCHLLGAFEPITFHEMILVFFEERHPLSSFLG